ncbi:H(+)/Cl(-) exchange transporter ClcA [Desulfovibrio inopinatus]|uniref:H(+)/Cl(-) exchange transporter ClcA n=1 Tax=Desulfovibrio inopinatus TaxID=102109 RepID=UPI0006858715|nr:H(+)/Cl(-) exchange transporter ClcA [Desulfovibrio inopinatus]
MTAAPQPEHPEHTPSEPEVPGAYCPISPFRTILVELGLKSRRYTLIFFLAILVGALAGLVGATFQILVVHVMKWLSLTTAFFNSTEFRTLVETWLAHAIGPKTATSIVSAVPSLPWLPSTVLCALMVTLAFTLTKRFAPEASGSGVQEIEGALEYIRPLRWRKVLPIKFIGGVLSLGSGMVLGREGPTIQLGGNLGEMISEMFGLDKDNAHILIASGAGAGLGAAFNAPLAGILFVVEEMRPQFHYNFLSVQCVVAACAAADIVLRMFTGQEADMAMTHFAAPSLGSLALFAIFGGMFGIFGYVFNFLLVRTLDAFDFIRARAAIAFRMAIGGMIGFLAWAMVDIVGGGYAVIPKVLNFEYTPNMLLFLFAARFLATMICYGSGAPGGIFAPMLALGTLFGMWFGHYATTYFPNIVAHAEIFTVAGMGALFAATVRAPLTGIILVVEMTMNYALILPLIVTCMAASVISEGLGGKPVYSILLERTLRITNSVKSSNADAECAPEQEDDSH